VKVEELEIIAEKDKKEVAKVVESKPKVEKGKKQPVSKKKEPVKVGRVVG
jgi:hypothetical protein